MPASLTTAGALVLLVRAVFIEILRRKDVYVLFILMFVFLLAVGVMRAVGIPDPATGTFLLNLGLYAASLSAHAVALGFAARAIPDEIENRTIYPLLATSLSRTLFVVGKWLGTSLAAMVVLLIMGLLAWVCIPHLEFYITAMLGQALLFQVGSLGLLVACTMVLSLFTPKGVAVAVCGLWFLGGSRLMVLLGGTAGWVGCLARVGNRYLPDFGRLNGLTRYTDGIVPLGLIESAALVGYVVLACSSLIYLCAWRFGRRAL